MRLVTTSFVLGLSVALAASCNRADREEPLEPEPTVLGDRNAVPPSPMTVDGCLTASGDRFVLTQLKTDAAAPGGMPTGAEPGTPQPGAPASADTGTEAYRLVGMHDQLRPHVGMRVRITGEAEPEQVVDVRQSSPPASPQPGGAQPPTGTTGEAQVGTTETARIEIHDLQVRSVSATGEPCAAVP